MRTERNVNINVNDNRGLATLVGLVIVIILTRLWWTGLLADMFAAAYSPAGEGMGSATYMMLAFLANVIDGIGTVTILAVTGLWGLIWDVASGVRQYMQERAAKRAIVDGVVNEEISSPALIDILQTIESNMQSIADKMDEIDARLSMAEEEIEKKTPARTTAKKA